MPTPVTVFLLREIEVLQAENATLRTLLKEQLNISGKCCYAKAPSYSKIREKLIQLGYKKEITSEIVGEENDFIG